jgi:hypothetical protein
MPSSCVKTVFFTGESLGKISYFCSISPANFYYVGQRLVFSTVCAQLLRTFVLIIPRIFNSLPQFVFFTFYPFSTGPTITTKLIKE